MNRLLSILILALAFTAQADAAAATSVTRWGVTWTFDGNYTVGTYCNGDPWVIGPVTITNVSPAWGYLRTTYWDDYLGVRHYNEESGNGMMINPVQNDSDAPQGWDTGMYGGGGVLHYDASKNAALSLPLTVAVNSSVVSSRGLTGGDVDYCRVINYAILTVVASAPAADAFRPAPYGSGVKTNEWRESMINYSALNNLAKSSVSSTLPNFTDLTERLSKPWISMTRGWTDGMSRALNQTYDGGGYGMELSFVTGDAGLVLNLDYSQAEKRELLIGTLQLAIDTLPQLRAGGWVIDGGHNSGKWTPIIVAAGVLGGEFLTYAFDKSKFQEGRETIFLTMDYFTTPMGWEQCCDSTIQSPTCGYFTNRGVWIPQQKLKRSSNCELITEFWEDSTDAPPTGNHVGSAWMHHSERGIIGGNNTWSGINHGYIDIVSASLTGPAMTARVMGLRDEINHEALFVYQERLAEEIHWSSSGWANQTPQFHKDFYAAFKSSGYVAPGDDTNAPSIIVNSVTTTQTNATLSISTVELSRLGIGYGTTTNLGTVYTNSTPGVSRTVTISNLTPATVYYYQITATDISTNLNSSNSPIASFQTDITNRVATPVITAGFGSLTNINFEASCETPGASIYLTFDGTTPTTGSTLYSGTFIITSNVTITAGAFKSGWTNSPTVASTFSIFTLPTPDASVPTNGMAFWFTAAAALTNSSGVSKWYDIGPNSRNAVAAVAPLRINGAINGQPVVRFDGTDDYLLFTNSVNGLTGMTVFVVSANLSDQTTDPYAVGKCAVFWNEWGGDASGQWGTVAVTPLQRFVGIRFGTGMTDNNTLFTRASSVGTAFNLICNMHSNTVDRVSTNGVLAQTWTGRLATIARCRDYGNLGRGYNDASFFNGDIAEVIVYERALSGEEKATVEGYLTTKYALSGVGASYPPVDPTFSLAAGSYPVAGGSTNVTVSCNATNTLRIWFSSGSPTILSSNTPAVMTVTNGQTLNAYATNAINGSGVTTASYVLTNPPVGTVEAPSIYPATGSYLESVSILIETPTPNAIVLWTTNYWATQTTGTSLTLTNSAVLIARATNLNWTSSSDSWGIFQITNAPPPPATPAVWARGGVTWR